MDTEDKFFANQMAFDLEFLDPVVRSTGRWLAMLWAADVVEAQRLAAEVSKTARAAMGTGTDDVAPGALPSLIPADIEGASAWQVEAAIAGAVVRRRVALEELLRRLLHPRNEYEAAEPCDVDPSILPEPRTFFPYPNLGRALRDRSAKPLEVTITNASASASAVLAAFTCVATDKLEREELAAAFVALARTRGKFDWVRPQELLDHAHARGEQWTSRPFGVPSLDRDGVVTGLLDVQRDPVDAARKRYRLSRIGLTVVVNYLIAYARRAASEAWT